MLAVILCKFQKSPMSHAHNRPLTSCRVSKLTGKHELFLGPLAKLFYGFFCLNMSNSSQMWLVCLLMVRTNFQMILSRCFDESFHRPPGVILATSKRLFFHAFWLLKKLTSQLLCRLFFPSLTLSVTMLCNLQTKTLIRP